MADIRETISADAMNPYFVDAQLMKRFSLRLAAVYGLPDEYRIKYLPPGAEDPQEKTLTLCSHNAVHKVVFSHFSSPPLEFEILTEKDTALLTVSTFVYYDKVDYFRSFMDSCFLEIKDKGINNLILDLRGNGGGDPFCSTILLSYLQKQPVRYFAEPYGKYTEFAEPLPLPKNHFSGNLYTFIDGSCGSTNGHFCALLKYHGLGKFIGTPSGSTYKCNAGKDTEFRLENTQLIVTIGRSTYAAAVQNMDKSAPLMPDVLVNETLDDFLQHRDRFLLAAFEQIEKRK
jgi:C-terminal processing protease CtpA/Prc